jgi:DNA polymerase V
MEEAVSNFAARCAQKLRSQNSCAGIIQVFIHTNSFNQDKPQYSNSRTIRLQVASDSTPQLIHYALIALKAIYKEGYEYKKAGVIVMGIVPKNGVQLSLFDSTDILKQDAVMNVCDKVNRKMGRNKVRFAVQNFTSKDAAWKMERNHLSPCYTTNWEELWTVNT